MQQRYMSIRAEDSATVSIQPTCTYTDPLVSEVKRADGSASVEVQEHNLIDPFPEGT